MIGKKRRQERCQKNKSLVSDCFVILFCNVINRTMDTGIKIGLFGIGLDTYWPQFAGLKERLEGYLEEVEEKLSAISPGIINAGLVDNTDKAFEAGLKFRKEDVDVL